MRSLSIAYPALLATADHNIGSERLRRRPGPGVWSVLEYAAHTRDTVSWYHQRIRLVLTTDRPQMPPFDWDAACEERRYVDEESDAVAIGLGSALDALADLLEVLDDASWAAAGIGSDGTERLVVDLARRAGHEGQHHLHDIGRIGKMDVEPTPGGRGPDRRS